MKTRITLLALACSFLTLASNAQLPMTRTTFSDPYVPITTAGGATTLGSGT